MARMVLVSAMRKGAAGILAAAAAVAVVLACLGADRSLDLMRYHAAIACVGALSFASALAAVWTWRRPAALAVHLGFALVLGGWAFNVCCGPQDGYLRLRAGQTGRVADVCDLRLQDFTIDHWQDTGAVRQYTSKVKQFPRKGQPAFDASQNGGDEMGYDCRISVNHPLVYRTGPLDPGWWVYQSSYQEMTNPHTGKPLFFTILLCVKDVGLPFVLAGGLLLLLGAILFALPLRSQGPLNPLESLKPLEPSDAPDPPVALKPWWPLALSLYVLAFLGAVAMLVHRGLSTGHAPMQNMYEFLMCTAAMLPLLTFFAVRQGDRHALLVDAALQALVLVPVAFFMDGRVKHLMPALQSPFFVPHVGAYVLGYVVLVRAAFGVGRRLVPSGFLLLTLGLVLGAAWGKVCWGHWWQFDPKEMWSLATWLVYAAYFHVRPRMSSVAERVFLAAGAVMIVLTLTWINLSRLFTGMHSYA
ncbi:MAG: cytochrome c biogenesis protein CcsA [Kiritimatiellae bacterium]|nr:cytochrome c biogenesis protein CcsA [Kiritimatiellia bacterium]